MTALPPPFAFAGEAAALTAAAIWACSMTAFRSLGRGIPPHQLNLVKNIVAFFCLGLTIVVFRGRLPDDNSTLLKLCASGIIGLAIGDTLLFAALAKLGAQRTAALQCLSPGFTAILALFMLGENLTSREWLGMFVTLTAVSLAVLLKTGRPASTSPREQLQGSGLAVLAALANALGIVIARDAMQGVDVAVGTASRVAPSIVFLTAQSLVLIRYSAAQTFKNPAAERPLSWAKIPNRTLLGIAVASFFGTYLGVMLMSFSTKYAKAGITAALTITYPIWIIPISFIVLKEPITKWQTILTLIAIAGVIILGSGY